MYIRYSHSRNTTCTYGILSLTAHTTCKNDILSLTTYDIYLRYALPHDTLHVYTIYSHSWHTTCTYDILSLTESTCMRDTLSLTVCIYDIPSLTAYIMYWLQSLSRHNIRYTLPYDIRHGITDKIWRWIDKSVRFVDIAIPRTLLSLIVSWYDVYITLILLDIVS